MARETKCYSADWYGWIGLNPIPNYGPIVNNINRLFNIRGEGVRVRV